jgi:hypothetical protein
MTLPAVGLAWYNGFTFSSYAETTSLRVRPIKSADGRTITESVISIEIQDYVASTISADTISTGMVIALTQPAAGFIYNGRGVGGIAINVGPPNAWDTRWGQFPTMLEMKPLGMGNAQKFRWGIDFCVPTCAGATYLGNQQPAEFCYKLSFDIDRGGYTKRIYSGFVRIPQTRRDITNRVPYITADQWRESINPPQLPGFRRIPGRFTVSEDRNRLDFEIIDEQLESPNALPPGCVEAEASHTYQSNPGNDKKWTSTVSGTYELAFGVSPNAALLPFLAMCKDRIDNAAAKMGPIPVVGAAAPIPGAAFIPIQFSAAETKIHGKPTASFGLSFAVVSATRDQILTNGGLFRPVPGSNAQLWQTSVAPILGSRGISGLSFVPNQDAILDLCVVAAPATPPPAGAIIDLRFVPPPFTTELRTLFEKPTSDLSWVDLVAWLSVETDSGVTVGILLPSSPLSLGANTGVWQQLLSSGLPEGALESTFFPQAADLTTGQQNSQSQAQGTTFVQYRTSPILYVTLHGYAIRVGYQIPIPQLLSVGGLDAVPCGRTDMGEGFEQCTIGNLGWPLFFAKWKLRYVIAAKTGTPQASTPNGPFRVPTNQLLGNAAIR